MATRSPTARPPDDATPPEPETDPGNAASTVGRAATKVRDFVSGSDPTPDPEPESDSTSASDTASAPGSASTPDTTPSQDPTSAPTDTPEVGTTADADSEYNSQATDSDEPANASTAPEPSSESAPNDEPTPSISVGDVPDPDAPWPEAEGSDSGDDSDDALPTDGDLYYWRVVTERGDEWSHGDRIESFVSVTAEQVRDADGDGEAPDRRESYGPAVALFSSAGAEAAAEATGDEERLAREREMGVAHEGVEAGQIIGFAGVVVAAIVIIVCVLFFWITSVAQTTREATVDTSVYPELRETETRAAQQLDQYELVSERDSTYRVPIGEAMRIVADEAYDQTAGRRYSGELRRDLPATASGDNRGGGNGPEPSAPEGPAGP
ncbi:hypothetical protein BRD04_03800 [Halobacteriales archaeon QS_9_67_17]|nr:MAG: hypothetical protein BRD04_03800 [Halobacteriales archaeon QS_9_67_17]